MPKYRIVPKRDFGGRPFLINGESVMTGFVITFEAGQPWSGCNAMPGGTWSRDIRGALIMIRVLEHVEGNALRFWRLLYRVNGATARSRRDRDAISRMLGRAV